MRKQVVLLRFPDRVVFDNRAVMSGEEVFLQGMFELAQGHTKHVASANVFGRDWSAQARAFNWFIDHIFDNFYHLVTDYLEWWWRSGLMKHSMLCIWRRMVLACPELKDIEDELSNSSNIFILFVHYL